MQNGASFSEFFWLHAFSRIKFLISLVMSVDIALEILKIRNWIKSHHQSNARCSRVLITISLWIILSCLCFMHFEQRDGICIKSVENFENLSFDFTFAMSLNSFLHSFKLTSRKYSTIYWSKTRLTSINRFYTSEWVMTGLWYDWGKFSMVYVWTFNPFSSSLERLMDWFIVGSVVRLNGQSVQNRV